MRRLCIVESQHIYSKSNVKYLIFRNLAQSSLVILVVLANEDANLVKLFEGLDACVVRWENHTVVIKFVVDLLEWR